MPSGTIEVLAAVAIVIWLHHIGLVSAFAEALFVLLEIGSDYLARIPARVRAIYHSAKHAVLNRRKS
jgi:hypothetical protein